jgi:hypothetical protein
MAIIWENRCNFRSSFGALEEEGHQRSAIHSNGRTVNTKSGYVRARNLGAKKLVQMSQGVLGSESGSIHT